MKRLYGCILLQILSPLVLAGSYFQIINLHTTKINTLRNAICFSTTGIFDKTHCGEYASGYYLSGPKTWKLKARSKRSTFSLSSSCKDLFDKNGTPEQSGQLDIFITLEKNSPSREEYILKNCYTRWKAAS